MKLPSIAEIKKELRHLDQKELIDLVIDMANFSNSNKQLLYFKLYSRDNPAFFQQMVEEELAAAFDVANVNNYYYAKKSAQAIRKNLNNYLKFTKDKSIKIELIAFFCREMHGRGFLSFGHPVIRNLYDMQLNKIQTLLNSLHEDLQFDYRDILSELKAY